MEFGEAQHIFSSYGFRGDPVYPYKLEGAARLLGVALREEGSFQCEVRLSHAGLHERKEGSLAR
jgi:hypothetical protein